MATSRTIRRTGPARAGSFLFLALRGDRPACPGARFSLAGAEVVSVGRADRLSARRDGHLLRIGVPDAGAFEGLVLRRVPGGFLPDPGGALIEGRKAERRPLHDGALVESGPAFFLYRDGLPGADDLLDARPGELSTLLPGLAEGLERLRAVARSRLPVLLAGEAGTGKKTLAAAIHRLSARTGPLVTIGRGGLAPGALESADKGTLLLDEPGDLAAPAQAALLRLLQDGEVVPEGSARPSRVDVRVVAATRRDPGAGSGLRADLRARLAGDALALPPLRERREDLSLLAGALLRKAGSPGASFSPAAARALFRYDWPGNLRELEQCLASALALSGGRIGPEHLPRAVIEGAPGAGPERERADALAALLRQHQGNVSAVARALGKARTQVQRWLRRYRLDPLAFRR